MSAEILWQPSKDQVHSTQLFAFMQRMAKRYGIEPTWPALHAWSCAQRDRFWAEMLETAAIALGHLASVAAPPRDSP